MNLSRKVNTKEYIKKFSLRDITYMKALKYSIGKHTHTHTPFKT